MPPLLQMGQRGALPSGRCTVYKASPQLTHGSGNYTTERVLSMQISSDIGLGKCGLPMGKKEMTA